LRPVLAAHDVVLPDEQALVLFGELESAIEAGPYRTYRDVLRQVLIGVGDHLHFDVVAAEADQFAGSVVDWPPFPDSADALRRLGTRFGLGVITNCDDDLFAASSRRLGDPFRWVVTAQQVGRYKPAEDNFEVALARIGVARDKVLHVAQSLYHDHVTAQQLGIATAWVNRRGDKIGGGATPPAAVVPDLEVPDMATIADLAGV
jgi:2-haloacid dehalogenase